MGVNSKIDTLNGGENIKINYDNEITNHTTETAITFLTEHNCTTYNGGYDDGPNAVAILEGYGYATIIYENKKECKNFELMLKVRFKNVIPRTYKVDLVTIKVYREDWEYLKSLREEYKSFAKSVAFLVRYHRFNDD